MTTKTSPQKPKTEPASESTGTHKAPRTRSPNYPAIDLGQAASKIRPLYEVMKRHPAGTEVAVKNMGYSEKSSTGKLVMAAMRAYGLLEDASSGMVKLTQRALDAGIDYPLDSTESKAALRDAALAPAIHKKLWDRYKNDLPGDDELRRHLVRDLGFNDTSVDSFIAGYKTTVTFSGLDKSSQPDENIGQRRDGISPVIGDSVQWTSNGVDQFESPRKVVGLDGEWAFIEGSQTGIPMAELTVVQPPPVTPAGGRSQPPMNPNYKPPGDSVVEKPGFALERSTLDEGAVTLQWPDSLSKESVLDFEYWIKGVLRRAKRKAGIKDDKPKGKPSADYEVDSEDE